MLPRDFASASFTHSYSGGVLTVSDGTHTATLDFVGFTGSFTFATDGSGGTLITDPPAGADAAAHAEVSAQAARLSQYMASSFGEVSDGAVGAHDEYQQAQLHEHLLAHPA